MAIQGTANILFKTNKLNYSIIVYLTYRKRRGSDNNGSHSKELNCITTSNNLRNTDTFTKVSICLLHTLYVAKKENV